MIEDLLIINDSGLLLFGWHPEGVSGEDQDNLISGFFTALNSFATFERGEDLKSIKLRESTIIFEKYEKLFQKLIFIITTKNDKMIGLLHSIVHVIMDSFVDLYNKELDREFDGSVASFRNFSETFNQILNDFGMDLIQYDMVRIDDKDILKAFILLNPLDGNVLYIYAKQYVNKEDISFLVPLMINTGKMLVKNFDENIDSISLTTIENEHLELILREKVAIVRLHKIDKKSDDRLVVIEFMKNKEKILKKPKKIEKMLENVNWGSRIRSIIFIDLLGNVLFSRLMKESRSFLENTTEIISFISSCKKASETIYNKELFNSSISSQTNSVICINLNTYILFAT
ncbi:MAG: hypothetical protein ACFFDK_14070, partial [Promethearchaeota archaeon]